MAAAPLSFGAQIREELTCSICLELFNRPKVLSCGHIFCQDCLQDLASRRVPFQCPNCRQQVRLPTQGVAGLLDSHIIANMCERLQQQTSLAGETKEQAQSGNRCSFHPSDVLKVYCKQCQIPVCEQCLEEDHDDHRTTTIKKAAQERSWRVQALINEGKNIMESYLGFLKSLREEEKALNEKKQQTDNSIIQAYNQMVQTLTKRKDHLLSEAGQNHTKNLDRIQNERERVLADVNELSAACDRAKQKLEQGWVEILSQQSDLREVVEKYRGKAAPTPVQTQPAVFYPTDTPVPVLGQVTVQSLPSAPVLAAPASTNVVARGTGHHQGNPEVQSLSSAPIPAAPARGTGHHHGNQEQEVQSLPSAPIPAAPASSNDTARSAGHHYDNQEQREQRMTFGGSGSGVGQFNGPCGVTVSDEGEIFVTDRENQRIQVFALRGTFVFFVRQFPTVVSGGQKMRPSDVAMDGKGNLWAVGSTKSAEFAVQYTKQGRVQRKFDLQKTGWVRGVAVDTRKNHILITQTTGGLSNPHGEVRVFRPDGTLVRTVGQQQWMKHPQYITVDMDGRILVSDWGDHRVYVYNDNGQFQFQFGGEGSGEGQLKRPHGICTDRAGNIIVADCGNSRVEMFDKTGRFLKQITTDMEGPQDVAMATQEQLGSVECGSPEACLYRTRLSCPAAGFARSPGRTAADIWWFTGRTFVTRVAAAVPRTQQRSSPLGSPSWSGLRAGRARDKPPLVPSGQTANPASHAAIPGAVPRHSLTVARQIRPGLDRSPGGPDGLDSCPRYIPSLSLRTGPWAAGQSGRVRTSLHQAFLRG
ncbi:TRIM3 [Branchiostoma lanceolatum]|uniref:RING-type E3 ubiquitin transferase n=1 Tax=Branchiostoma lanceolatum TaxID=7740 RepID=A0A8K0EPM2_BRALA|nr:TRIM3 [Branchiostoma lanceolatum]